MNMAIASRLEGIWNSAAEKPQYILLTCLVGCGLGILSFISPLAVLAIVMTFTLSVIALQAPITIGYLMILGITLTSGMARGQWVPFLIPNEIVLFFAFCLTFPFIVMRKWKTVRIPPVLVAGQALLVGGTVILPCITYYMRGIALTPGETLKLLAPLQYLLLFWLYLYLPDNDRERFTLIRWMWVCASVVAIVGLLQSAGFKPVIAFLNQWYPSEHTTVAQKIQRATSLMAAWNGLGTFLMVNLLLMRAHQSSETSRSYRVFWGIAAILCFSCLLACGSYAGLVGLIIGYLIIGYLDKGGLRDIGVIILGFVISIIPLYSIIVNRFNYQFEGGGIVPQTFLFRLKVWKDVFWPILQDSWLWGYRPSLQALSWKWAESQYIALILRSGIFSLISHIIWVFMTVVWLYKTAFQKHGLSRSLAVSLLAILVVLSIMGLTNEVFTFSGSIDFVWVLLGLLAGSVGASVCKPAMSS